jgi:hypothetical protein
MCRSIKTLRPPYTDEVGPAETQAAALQYVRKIAGMRVPSAANAAAFDQAVQAVSAATAKLLDELVLRPTTSKHAREFANHSAHAQAHAAKVPHTHDAAPPPS